MSVRPTQDGQVGPDRLHVAPAHRTGEGVHGTGVEVGNRPLEERQVQAGGRLRGTPASRASRSATATRAVV
jgi:hypothetical protein